MKERGWNSTEMAAAVTQAAPGSKVVHRQDIDNLVKGDVNVPRYIKPLAKVIGMSIDEMLGMPRESEMSFRARSIAADFDEYIRDRDTRFVVQQAIQEVILEHYRKARAGSVPKTAPDDQSTEAHRLDH